MEEIILQTMDLTKSFEGNPPVLKHMNFSIKKPMAL